MNYQIVQATPEHLPALAGIELAAAQLFPEYLLPGNLTQQSLSMDVLHRGMIDRLLWVAVDSNDIPVGFVLLAALQDLALVREMDVHPDHQQRGLGRQLLAVALQAARDRGFSSAGLTTFATVPWNAPFYQRQGFRTLNGPDVPTVIREILVQEKQAGLKDRVAMLTEL